MQKERTYLQSLFLHAQNKEGREMTKLGHTLDSKSVKKLPSEVVEEISKNLIIPDEKYRVHRNIFENLGGYL